MLWHLEDKHASMAFEEKLKFKGRSVSVLLSYANLDKSLCRPYSPDATPTYTL